MPRPSYAQGLQALEQLAESYDGSLDRNEATTRLHLIDQLLFEVLAWDRNECGSEDPYEGRYTDYSLGHPARRLIVEAKREGIAFELPAGQRGGVVPIKSLLSDPGTAAAMEQALGYAQRRGVPFVAVANGHQLIAFIASRQDGVPPLDGRALIFTSLEEMKAQFRLLWDNLSAEGVGLQLLQRTLRDVATATPPPKLSERLPRYPRFRVRNRLQTDLQILADLFIEDVVHADEDRREEFLKACYSTSGALSQYALLSREILRTRYSAMMQSELGVSTETASVGEEATGRLRQDVLSAALARRPIVLLGDVGVGKTIFIQHLMHIDAKDVFGDAITLYIDFLAEPAVVTQLTEYVSRSIAEQLRENYDVDIEEMPFVMGAYHSDLQRFDKSVFGHLKEIDPPGYDRERLRFLTDKVADTESHLRRSLEHLVKGRRKQIVIFLDNIDQRPAAFQEQVYGISHAIAESWPAAVFVSLRPSTFFVSKRTGSLAAYQPRVFTIAPPRIDVVLKRRIAYVLDRLKSEGSLGTLPAGVHLEVESLEDYLGALLNSLEKSEPFVELIDNLSGGNVRRALEFVQTFIGSGNVDTDKMLERIRAYGSFTIEVHQFLRAILLGDYQDYVPDASPIANIFDLLSPDGREHFLIPILVAEIERTGGVGGEEGFVRADSVYDYAQPLGFTPAQIGWALERAASLELLELRHRSEHSSEALYRVTSIGTYSTHRLPGMFAYLDVVVSDTPVIDPSFRERITDAFALEDRLGRAELFRLYLDRQWNGLGGYEPAFNWEAVSQKAREDIWALGRRFAGWP